MKILGLIFAALISSVAMAADAPVADFAGIWVGNAKLTPKTGPSTNCETVEIRISQSATELHFEHFYLKCGGDDMNGNPVDYVIHGNDVLYNGQKTGTISKDSIHIQSSETQSFDATIKGKSIHFTGQETDPDSAYTFEGDLKKAN